MVKKLLILVLVASFNLVKSQDQVLLLNGATINCEVQSVTQDLLQCVTTKSSKSKNMIIARNRVFSYTKKNKNEVVVYKQDSTIGNNLSADHMRLFIYGTQDAYLNYKGNLPLFLGMGIGLLGGAATAESFLIVTVPLLYTTIGSFRRINPNEESARDSDYLNEPAYIAGYRRVGKQKRLFRALIGSLVGTAIGAGLYYAVEPSLE